jgi:hypothetical protein
MAGGLPKTLLRSIIVSMSESNYCKDCNRLKDIACTCGMTFAEKIKTTSVNWATWSDTRKGS